jgi:hypothetical protein
MHSGRKNKYTKDKVLINKSTKENGEASERGFSISFTTCHASSEKVWETFSAGYFAVSSVPLP